MRNVHRIMDILLVSTFFFGVPLGVIAAEPFTVADITAAVNHERTSHGLPQLTTAPKLGYAAHTKAQDMVQRDYFAHTSPSGESAWTWIDRAGYAYTRAAENLAAGYMAADDLVAGWMASAGHRENILTAGFTEVGAGIALDADMQGTIVVLFLATPVRTASQEAPPPPTKPAKNPAPDAPPAAPTPPVQAPIQAPIQEKHEVQKEPRVFGVSDPVVEQTTIVSEQEKSTVPSIQSATLQPQNAVRTIPLIGIYPSVDNLRRVLLHYLRILADPLRLPP